MVGRVQGRHSFSAPRRRWRQPAPLGSRPVRVRYVDRSFGPGVTPGAKSPARVPVGVPVSRPREISRSPNPLRVPVRVPVFWLREIFRTPIAGMRTGVVAPGDRPTPDSYRYAYRYDRPNIPRGPVLRVPVVRFSTTEIYLILHT